MLVLTTADGLPKDRMRVKYRVKSGAGKRVVDKAVAEVVNLNGMETGDEILNEEQEGRLGKDFDLNTNLIEEPTPDEVFETVAGMEDELKEGLGEILGEYGASLVDIAQGINRAARFNERNVGDVIFDVVKEVVAELVGSMLFRSFGIGTARGGQSGLIEIILSAISSSAQPKSC